MKGETTGETMGETMGDTVGETVGETVEENKGERLWERGERLSLKLESTGYKRGRERQGDKRTDTSERLLVCVCVFLVNQLKLTKA